MFNGFGRCAAVASLLVAMTGCATVERGIPEKLNPGSGVVIMKVVSLQRLGYINGKWSQVWVSDKATSQPASLEDTADFDAQYAAFAQPLPAGTYTVRSIDAPGIAVGAFGLLPALAIQAMTSGSQDSSQSLSSFTVEAGKVTNLGVVVAAPPEGKEKTIQLAVLADERARSAARDDIDTASRARAKDLPERTWDVPPAASQYDRAFELVRTRSTLVSPLEVTRDGRLLVGTGMGLVHVRDAGGAWTTMSTGSLDSLGLVRELSDGRIFAATQRGAYHLWDPKTRSWTYRRIAEEGRIVELEAVGASGYALQLHHSGILFGQQRVTRVLMVQDLAANTPPREALRLTETPAMKVSPMVYDGRDLVLVFNEMGFSRTAKVHRIDPVSLQIRLESQPQWIERFQHVPGGAIARTRVNGMSRFSETSSDKGASWQLSENTSGFGATFSDIHTGYGLAIIQAGMNTVTTSLSTTSDGGKTWAPVGKTFDTGGKGVPTQLVIGADGRPFVYTGTTLLSSGDQGKTWSVEWPRPAATR
ncbi:MAG: hypothetical protein RLZZ618_916 [Pseudomonadota bacterium]|jgi:hypothetical protein